jgi:outer membrane protein assembly factor BamB
MGQNRFFAAGGRSSFILLLATIGSASEEWPQFGGPHRNFTVVTPSGAKTTPSPPWQVQVEAGDDSPIVTGDRVIVAQLGYSLDGTEAHRVSCYSFEDGKIVWEQSFSEPSYPGQDISDGYPVRPLATCAAADGAIVTVGFGGTVRCLSVEDGALRWEVDLVKDHDADPIQYGMATSPWIEGNSVIVACGGPKALVLALDLRDGSLVWKSGNGVASYASFVDLNIPAVRNRTAERHLIYAAGNGVVAVDPTTGRELWQFEYPELGLTNAVTPIPLDNGHLLLGGQGLNGVCLLKIAQTEDGEYSVDEVWQTRAMKPFYCNWILHRATDLVIGFDRDSLLALDWKTGDVIWKERGWTDVNLTGLDEKVLAVRGDGVVALLDLDRQGTKIEKTFIGISDRVWAPLSVSKGRIFARGRNSLHSFGVSALKEGSTLPAGNEVTAMDAMYGSPPQSIADLLTIATESPGTMTLEAYQAVANDRSIFLSDGRYEKILNPLLAAGRSDLARDIAQDWMQRRPQSVPAYLNYRDILIAADQKKAVEDLDRERLVKVSLEVDVLPESTTPPDIYLACNALTSGGWKADGVKLTKGVDGKYFAELSLPRGDLRFKLTQGTWESVECRADGRDISDRRIRISGPTKIKASVERWK